MGGEVARAAAIDDGEWTGAASASVAGGARLPATLRLDREPSAAPPRGGSPFAALVSLVGHAAIVVAAALSLGAPQPTGEPDAIAVELVAATDAAPRPAQRDDIPPSLPASADNPAPVPASASQPATPNPTEASDAAPPAPAKAPSGDSDATAATTKMDVDPIPTPPKSVDAADATDDAPPAPPARDTATAAAQTVVAPTPVLPPPRSASAPPEADLADGLAAPHTDAKRPAKPPTTTRTVVRLEPAARPAGARAAATAHGLVEIAAYRSALLAKIWGAARYPETARERGATGVATVRFALDGAGAVTLADLAQSSGDRALDDEAMAAVRRASPLPAPPVGAPHAYSAPIRFELR